LGNESICCGACARSTNGLHNVLFADCDLALLQQSSYAEVDAEQVTADVDSFCDPEYRKRHA